MWTVKMRVLEQFGGAIWAGIETFMNDSGT